MILYGVTIVLIVVFIVSAVAWDLVSSHRQDARRIAKLHRQRLVETFEREDYRERHNSATHPNWRREV